jgi:thiamine pyrophosphokinase
MVLFMSRAVIFVNGHIPDLNLVHPLIRSGDMILAANGGTSHALALGLIPSTVIGDLDSLSAEHRRQLDLAGTEFKRFPRDKNETDLELVPMLDFPKFFLSPRWGVASTRPWEILPY